MSRTHHAALGGSILAGVILNVVTPCVAAQTMAPFPEVIAYKQTVTKMLDTSDILGWPPGFETDPWREFGAVLVSADGSKVYFSACVPNAAECRPFLVNPNGSGLVDAEAIFPVNLASRWWAWGNMAINDDGSRIFIKAQLSDGTAKISYYDVATTATGWAVDHFWWGFDWFTLKGDGSKLFVGKYDQGYDPVAERNIRGLYSAQFGGAGLTQYFDIFDLPCSGSCNNLNFASHLGNSANGNRAFFSWMSIYEGNADPDNRSAMWFTNLDHGAQKLTSEDHVWVWDGNWRGVANDVGSLALYQYRHRSGDAIELDVIDVGAGTASLVTWTSDLNGLSSFLTRSGKYALVTGGRGDSGYHYKTMFDLERGTARDTWSAWIPVVEKSSSNITSDDRYYFVTNADSMSRVDMKADQLGDFSRNPNINAIAFTAPHLWHDDSAQIGITVNVSDAQGLANIENVRLAVLVEGVEDPAWDMPREPLAFPAGDPGWTLLYDDGTNGDAAAGDGVFTFDSIATRKTDPLTWNTWYSHFTLPHQVGIRIIANDLDGNSTIADTTLWITDEDISPVIFIDGFETSDTTAWSRSSP